VTPGSGSVSARAAKSVTAPPTPDNLTGFAGTAQASNINSFGGDQEVTPPNEDIAVGVDIVEVVNSTIVAFSRSGTILGSDDLNTFMHVARGYHSSDPRVIYDTETGHLWVTVTEVPNSGCRPAPVLIAVSANANPLPFTGWRVYALPIEQSGTTFGDQPGLGADSNTIVVTFDDFSCGLGFLGSEIDILQKSDLETDTGLYRVNAFYGGPFAPQPVEELYGGVVNYVVTNESDCGSVACPSPQAEVDLFQGSPESGGVNYQPYVVGMTATAVNTSTGFLPPADQPSPGPKLQTNDDRFLNAVENQFGEIWTADGTSCVPPGDSVPRACLDYLEISVSGGFPTLTAQLDNVGIDGADLFYPAVAVDSAGNLLTVFDQSSTSMYPSIMDAYIAQGGSTLSSFQTLHTSSTYYNGNALFAGACGTEGCRWGDYSGAAIDGANGSDIWVVSGSEDNSVEDACVAHACWNTRINQLTLAPPTITALSPSLGPLVGGQTITVTGRDFAPDTTFAAEIGPGQTYPIPVDILNPELLTFVTPPAAAVGGTLDIQESDSLGYGLTANYYQYVSLANYVPVSPFRILDTRSPSGGGPLGPGESRLVQVSGVGSMPVPQNATAYVLNVTEVNGTAASLLTVYPAGDTRPNASNLNFAAHTVIANAVTVTIGGRGQIEIYNALGSVNVLVDIEGYFEPEPSSDYQGLFHPIAPVRMCDTRTPASCDLHGALGAEQSIAVTVAGSTAGEIPNDGTAGAAVVNLTGVAGTASTYLSLFPTDSSGGCQYGGSNAPTFSTISLPAGAVQANRVMVELGPASTGGPDTSLCVYNSSGTINVLVDANGWYGSATATATPAGYQYQGIPPTRVCDTRVSTTSCLQGAIGAAVSRLMPIAGDSYIPSTTSGTTVVAIIANLTAVAPTAACFLTLYPAYLTMRPGVSDLNLNAGVVLPNLAIVELDTTADAHDGEVYLYNSAGSVNAIIDIEGWFQ
jgi:hypothetical protein